MTLQWVPIDQSGLSVVFTANPANVGTVAMSGSVISSESVQAGLGQTNVFTLAITPLPPALETKVRITIVDFATLDNLTNTVGFLPARFSNSSSLTTVQVNEAAPYPSATWTLPTGPQDAWTPAPFEYVIDGTPVRYLSTLEGVSNLPLPERFSMLVEALINQTNYNCDCDDENNNQTLSQLRTRLLRRVGASAMTAVPGPGMAELADDFLQSSQEMLYREYDVLRTMRFFTWNLQQGVRFYDLQDNIDQCQRKWDPRKVVWVGISGADEWWQPLRCGIQPEFYSWNDVQGWPQLYEVRQCIEIWPAPDNQAWKLRVKGDFGLEAFAADGDKTTIDSEAVFLHALARFKAHLQQPDARNYEADCMRYIGNLTAGAHQTRRYVPGAVVEPNAIPPVWLPLNGGPP